MAVTGRWYFFIAAPFLPSAAALPDACFHGDPELPVRAPPDMGSLTQPRRQPTPSLSSAPHLVKVSYLLGLRGAPSAGVLWAQEGHPALFCGLVHTDGTSIFRSLACPYARPLPPPAPSFPICPMGGLSGPETRRSHGRQSHSPPRLLSGTRVVRSLAWWRSLAWGGSQDGALGSGGDVAACGAQAPLCPAVVEAETPAWLSCPCAEPH